MSKKGPFYKKRKFISGQTNKIGTSLSACRVIISRGKKPLSGQLLKIFHLTRVSFFQILQLLHLGKST